MKGQCKLCLEIKDLQDSHYLSKGIYKRLREKDEKNPNPWLISSKTAFQTSRQLRSHLLCSDCEQRLSKKGENWVIGHCLQEDDCFPLASILALRRPDVSSPNNPTKIYYASNIPEIDTLSLAYFAASIFWRGSIYGWNIDGSVPVKLGPYKELLRQYLMGLNAFPRDCSLWTVIREGKEVSRLTFTPVSERQGNFHVHKFPLPGIAFALLVSKNLPASFREKCLVHGVGNPIIVTSLIEPLLADTAFNMLSGIP